MRIVFMGTPDFAVASLEALHQSPHEVVAVVTAPDKPAGRGQKLRSSAVKQYALAHKLPVLQPLKLRSEEFLTELKNYQPDLLVVVAFRMLPAQVWQLPPQGTINLHASLLPQYRGAAPINWAIINGEIKSGVTTFFINENIDTGDLIMRREVTIDEKDTAGSYHDKLMQVGAKLLRETVDAIDQGRAPRQSQQTEEPIKEAPKIFKEHTHIDFARPVKKVYDFIRGLSPYPAATASLIQDGKKYNVKFYEVSWQQKSHDYEPGKALSEGKKALKIATNDGFIVVEKLQIQGKKAMKVADLLNGFTVLPEARFA